MEAGTEAAVDAADGTEFQGRMAEGKKELRWTLVLEYETWIFCLLTSGSSHDMLKCSCMLTAKVCKPQSCRGHKTSLAGVFYTSLSNGSDLSLVLRQSSTCLNLPMGEKSPTSVFYA